MNDKKAKRKERLKKRNTEVRELFKELSEKYKKYKITEVINEVAKQMYLSPRTTEAIIFYEGIYKET